MSWMTIGFRFGQSGLALFTALSIFGCGASAGTAAPSNPNVQFLNESGKFRNTYYYMVFEADYPKARKTAEVLAMDGTLIAKVTPAFYKDLLMEGSGTLRDGRVLNWAGRVNDLSRFHVTSLKWGRGTGDCALVPFHTIAADPTQIPAGAVVRIEETVGMLLPNGKKSDGIWRAEDTGGAILHDRIDLFIGKKSYNTFLTGAKIGHLQALTVTILEQPLPDSCVFKDPR